MNGAPSIPTKCWFILREDINFNSDRLFKLGIQTTNQPFHSDSYTNEDNIVLRQEWIKSGSKVETRMMFNAEFLHRLETKLIQDGIIFKWVYSNKTISGIFIEPCTDDISNLYLSDCMTLENFAKYRLKEFNELVKRDEI